MTRNPNDIQQQIPQERMINYVLSELECLGTHPMLTNVSVLLMDAQRKLAEWIDAGRPGAAKSEHLT